MNIEQAKLSSDELVDLRRLYLRRRHAAVAWFEDRRASDAAAEAARNLAAAYHPHQDVTP